MPTNRKPVLHRLLANSRFWILAFAIVASINIAGLVQWLIPPGQLQVIRLEQIYGGIALGLLYLALLASPLTKAVPGLPGAAAYLHARRAIGVSAFYFAALHAYLAFFEQLDGIGGIAYYDTKYKWALSGGVLGLAVLCVMAATSLDWAVRVMGFRHWKMLHRLVYGAGIALLLHIVLIGSHYARLELIGTITAVGVLVLLTLECSRLFRPRQAGRRT